MVLHYSCAISFRPGKIATYGENATEPDGELVGIRRIGWPMPWNKLESQKNNGLKYRLNDNYSRSSPVPERTLRRLLARLRERGIVESINKSH